MSNNEALGTSKTILTNELRNNPGAVFVKNIRSAASRAIGGIANGSIRSDSIIYLPLKLYLEKA